MSRKIFTLLILAFFSGIAMADRPLDRSEILQIFDSLTSSPRKTWISSGTIQANHDEYKFAVTTDETEIAEKIDEEIQAYLDKPDKVEISEELQDMMLEAIPFNVRYSLSNEYTMSSETTVKFDGERFYWEIAVVSRADSIEPPAELENNGCLMHFDLYWNQKRVFAWDGEKYINYFRPGNNATISDTRGSINGALTAGIIGWGYGHYSYTNLISLEASASEVELDGQTEIHLTIADGQMEETFILDSDKNYAVKQHTKNYYGDSLTVSNYGNYEPAGNEWCPGVIVIEEYESSTSPAKLMSRDIWRLDSIDKGTLEAADFDVEFEYDALIEDFRFGDEALQYRYSVPEVSSGTNLDIDALLSLKLKLGFCPETEMLNCATASMKYVAERLGKDITLKDIAKTMNMQDESVSLFALQQSAAKLGFYCQAVKTNLESLRYLSKYPVILHLPESKHFVVLGDIDENLIGLIDLTDKLFYDRKSAAAFETVWDGTAVVVTNTPIELQGKFAKIDDSQTRRITGAQCGGGQSCTDVIQQRSEIQCEMFFGTCTPHTIFFKRYGCEEAASGICSTSQMPKLKYEPCITDPHNPDTCIGTGDWSIGGYMWACK